MEHIHVGVIDFLVVTAYLIVAHWAIRVTAYTARRRGHTSLSGALGALL